MNICYNCDNNKDCELQDMGCMDSVIACVEFKEEVYNDTVP